MTEFSRRQVLILAGMHRSMTSLVAKSFLASGLYLGDDLIGATPANPDGHYESQKFVAFHLDMIKQYQLKSWWRVIDPEKAKTAAQSVSFQTQAQALFLSIASAPLVGWKDPRTALFIHGWSEVIPDAYYILIVRDPVSCVHSLIRRSTKGVITNYRPLLANRFFNLWEVTNRSILTFYKEQPHRCILLHTPEDLMNPNVERALNNVLLDQWQLALEPINFQKHLNQEYIRSQHTPNYLRGLYHFRPKTKKLYEELRRYSLGAKVAESIQDA